MKLLYLLSLAGARRMLDLQSPYVVLDESTRWSLTEARRRGVRVRLLVEGDLTDAKPVKYASRADYDALLAAGIEIYEFQPTMMHVKALVVDGIWSIVGSTNFDNRSLELNDEINVGMADRDLAARLTEDFEADLRRSHRLTLEDGVSDRRSTRRARSSGGCSASCSRGGRGSISGLVRLGFLLFTRFSLPRATLRHRV